MQVNIPAQVTGLTAPVTGLADFPALAAAWQWLVPAVASYQAALMTALGDVFLRTPSGEIVFLDADAASAEFVAKNEKAWLEMLNDRDAVEAWFSPGLTRAVAVHLGPLAENMVYCTVHPPYLGGTYELANFGTRRWDAYLWVAGQVHRQIKSLPPGEKVTLHFEPW